MTPRASRSSPPLPSAPAAGATSPAPAAPRAEPWQGWAALWTLYIVWGSTYFAIAIMVETVPPLLAAGTRFILAGIIVLAWVRLRRGRGALRITRAELLGALAIGTCLMGGNAIVTAAEQEVPSALAALIYAAIPLWVVVLRAIARERIARTTAVAVSAGFGGVALLLLPGEQTAGASAVALGACVAGSFVWSLGLFGGPRTALSRDPVRATGWQMLLGGAVWALAGLVAGEAGDVDPDRFSLESVAAFAYLVVFGSLLAFTVLTWALEHLPLSRVATYPFVNPVVALALGALLRDEPITPLALVAAAVIVASVALVVRSERL